MKSQHYIPFEECFKNIIHSIWQIDHLTVFHQENIIPKGVVEIIFNFGDRKPIVAGIRNRQFHLSKCFINGFNTAPIHIQLPKQQIFFGILFQPLAVRKILRTPAGEFSDQTVDLTLIDPEFDILWHQLANESKFNNRVNIILKWLRKNLIDWKPQEQLVNTFLYTTGFHEISAGELSDKLCYSPRQLTRKFQEATGMNTEEILLYKKYLHSVELIHNSDLPLTTIAYLSKFSDQSHFNKTFKTFTGITPGQYKSNKSMVKGHLYENVR